MPSSADKHAKWLEWVNTISPVLHAPLTTQDLEKPLKYQLPTNSSSANKDSLPELPEGRGKKRPASEDLPDASESSKKPTLKEIQ